MTSELLTQLLEGLFFSYPADLADRLLSGEFRDWGEAADLGMTPRIAFLAAPCPDGQDPHICYPREANRALLAGLKGAMDLQILDPQQPFDIYFSLVAAIAHQLHEAAMLLRQLDEATSRQESRNARS